MAEARDTYRPIATRGSLIYFVINQLSVVDHMYQYSLGAFHSVFEKALENSEGAEDVGARCAALLASTTLSCFTYVTRGLYERHRLTFSLQLG